MGKKNILYIDGQNFLGKLKDVFDAGKVPLPDWGKYDFMGLLNGALEGIKINEYRIYLAKIHFHEDTPGKSKELIEERRRLKAWLEKQGFQYHRAGNVRAYPGKWHRGEKSLSFREKGVDVRIAVDMVVDACDKVASTMILASSDSDYQPAVKEIIKRGAQCIYLGFEQRPNKGLIYTTSRAILIRNAEVLKYKRS